MNRGILTATRRLVALVDDPDIADRLDFQRNRLRQHVSETLVTATELEQIDLTRLNQHYETALSLARIVLSEKFFEDISPGDRQSFALFLNMNSIFEAMVERAFREASHRIDEQWHVEGQASIPNLIDGPHAVSMTPDVVVSDSDRRYRLVGDAKWKTGSRSSGDVYQLTSYILALDVPGLIVYPKQSSWTDHQSVVDETHILRSVTLPTATSAATYREYRKELVAAAEDALATCFEIN